MPYIAVPVSQDFVQHMAELPAKDGAAGKSEAQSVGPEGEGSLLPVSAQYDSCCPSLRKQKPSQHCAFYNPFRSFW